MNDATPIAASAPRARGRRTLLAAFDPRRNNFDLIRLAAASLVVFTHAYSLAGPGYLDPFSGHVGLGYGGTLAVEVFFVISGFLITRSAIETPAAAYLLARALRILPGLALVTVIEAFVIGLCFHRANPGAYLAHDAVGHLWNILVFPEVPWIAGVFPHNHYAIVNGSLWTLPVEAFFYLLMPVLASSGRLFLPAPVALWLGCLGLSAAGALDLCAYVAHDREFLPGLYAGSVTTMGGFFFAGSLLWQLRRAVPADGAFALIAAILLLLARNTGATAAVLDTCLPYLVIWVGVRGGAGAWLKRRIGDPSYGTYLFGYPLLNSVIAVGRQRFVPELVFAVAYPLILLAGLLSWRLVERPALRLRRSHDGRERRPGD